MHRVPTSARAPGAPAPRVTRGKTTPNRLRGADHFLLAYAAPLLRRADGPWRRALVIDLGYGETPGTTLELAARLRRANPRLPLLGVEIDPRRVERALPLAGDGIAFRRGGFDLPLRHHADGVPETVRLVRAFNVLRQYEEHEAVPAWERLAVQLLPGGLLVDGTSDPTGRVWTAALVRRPADGEGTAVAAGAAPIAGAPAWELEALVFGANLRCGLDPGAFQTRLPKAMIHRVVPDDPVGALVDDWLAACRDSRAAEVWGPRAWFAAAARAVAARGRDVALRPRWLRHGWLVWRRPDLVTGH